MEFHKVGAFCSYCNCQDYLPYKCIDCNKWFCEEHKKTEKHECIPIKKKVKKKLKKKLIKLNVIFVINIKKNIIVFYVKIVINIFV